MADAVVGGGTGPSGDRASLGKAEQVARLIALLGQAKEATANDPELQALYKEALSAAQVGLGLKRLGE